MFSRKLTRSIAIGATVVAIGGATVGIVGATANTGASNTAASPSTATPAQHPSGNRGSNARSGPAAGGSSGVVDSVSKASFAVTTATGQRVTVEKTSTTTYEKGTSSSSASAVKAGVRVLVLGTTSGTTITASRVIVQPTGGSASSPRSTGGVVPFQPGERSTSKQAGQIPASYTQGSGTIVGGTAANKATEAALTRYPGGIVDRVVKLSNGEYEVHNIGVDWPHHIFVSQSFKVVGAD